MSHSHTPTEKPKKIKQEIEALKESREIVAAAKAELLGHNPILKFHGNENLYEQDNQKEAVASNLPPRVNYIKKPEDRERIKKTLSEKTIPEKNDDMVQYGVARFFSFQYEVLAFWMESWSHICNQIIFVPTSKNSGTSY